ncbi:MAG: hypothetical protein ABJA98_16810 [Acidobacteriota bacterium]
MLGLLLVFAWSPAAPSVLPGRSSGSVAAGAPFPALANAATALPERLSDQEFWTLISDISEPGGYFRITDNYTSNEREVGQLASMLRETGVQGGVYLGVGPEQNLSYIAAIRPAMAFVIDIRRQAVVQHLLFKAVFELSADRADFISLLFSKPRPAGLTPTTPIQQIWNAYESMATDRTAAEKSYERIVQQLTGSHGFTLTANESSQLESVFHAFLRYGPAISTRGSSSGQRGVGNNMNFADLTGWSFDAAGQPQSFLSTEENFSYVKSLEQRNLVVPVSGDFAGPKAIRAIGAYLRAQGGIVSAFYLSNVEQYLFQDRKDRAFYDNLAMLPTTEKSVFIRPYSMRVRGSGDSHPLCAIDDFLSGVRAGRVSSNNDALACAR